LLPAGAVIVGGGANMAGILDVARRELDLPVEKGRFSGVETARGDLLDSSWAVAIGLCIIARNNANQSSAFFNFSLPGSGSKIGRWLRSFLP